MSRHVMVTLAFTRPVQAHELRPGDTFAFPDTPRTQLTVLGVQETVFSPELTLVGLTLPGHAGPMNLPANTPLQALRMLRTVSLPCLLCHKSQDIELDLPRDGEPLSVVCADHVPDPEQREETER